MDSLARELDALTASPNITALPMPSGPRAHGLRRSAAREAVDALVNAGERVGMVTVRLYRPFPAAQFISALPPSVRSIAVLDRQRSQCRRRAALSRRPYRRGRSDGGCRGALQRTAADASAAATAVIEGIHAAHGQGGARRADQPRPKRQFTVGSSTT